MFKRSILTISVLAFVLAFMGLSDINAQDAPKEKTKKHLCTEKCDSKCTVMKTEHKCPEGCKCDKCVSAAKKEVKKCGADCKCEKCTTAKKEVKKCGADCKCEKCSAKAKVKKTMSEKSGSCCSTPKKKA